MNMKVGMMVCVLGLLGGVTSAEPVKSCCANIPSRFGTPVVEKPAGMVWIEGGEFLMGTNEAEAYSVEKPAHPVKVAGFWMDETEVTNLQFKEFVDATGYVTTAEIAPDWEEMKKQVPPGTPKPSDDVFVASSLVFIAPTNAVPLNDIRGWWHWVPGANWKHPEGPGSDLEGRWDHPVVQVSWDDATAYAKWAGKRLPTEAEWEFAARGGLEQNRYAWGSELTPDGRLMANYFQGTFPNDNKLEDGFARTAPVKHFPANGYGLYEMTGNVWEWTADWYDVKAYAKRASETVLDNPQGPAVSFHPAAPYEKQRSIRGGSFLCCIGSCVNYRPSARLGSTMDTGMSHLGFRCVKSAP